MNKSSNSGFTIIELVVTISLIVGLVTVLVIQGSTSREQNALNGAAQVLEAAFIRAQSLGNSGHAFPEGTNNFDNGYGVYVNKDTDQIFIYGGDYDGDGVWSPDEERYGNVAQQYEVIELTGGIKVSEIRTNNHQRPITHILFRRGEGPHIYYTSNNNLQREARITLQSSSGMEKNIFVNETGLIYIAD